jgi:hypothetical protein
METAEIKVTEINDKINYKWFADFIEPLCKLENTLGEQLSQKDLLSATYYIYVNPKLEEHIKNIEGFLEIEIWRDSPIDKYTHDGAIGMIGNFKIFLDPKIKGFAISKETNGN